jgi:glycine cleavage system H protein
MAYIPDELRYTNSHEWVQLMDDGTVRVGITDFAQEQLGDIVHVEPPTIGQRFIAGTECAAIESVKSASDLYCPLAGEIVEFNEQLADSAGTINEDPYGEGWIFRIKPESASEIDDLLDSEAYEELLQDNDD